MITKRIFKKENTSKKTMVKSRLAKIRLPLWLSGQESASQCRRHQFDP